MKSKINIEMAAILNIKKHPILSDGMYVRIDKETWYEEMGCALELCWYDEELEKIYQANKGN